MPVNVTDRILILEQDDAQLSWQIEASISAVLEKYIEAYLPDLKVLPAPEEHISVKESLTTNDRKRYRSRVRICQVLQHHRSQHLGRQYLVALELYIQLQGKGEVPYINDPRVAEGLRIAQGFFGGKDIITVPFRLILLKLVERKVLLLPLFNLPSYIPQTFGPKGQERLLDLLPRPLKELVLTLRPSLSEQTSINWRLTAGAVRTRMVAEGSDYQDWKPGEAPLPTPGFALSVGAATTWHDIADVTAEEVVLVQERASTQQCGNRAVKLYLNCLYLCRHTDVARQQFFEALALVPGYRIYTEEYIIWAQRAELRRYREQKYGMKNALDTAGSVARHKMLALTLGRLSKAFIQGGLDDESFVASLSTVPSRRLILNLDEFDDNGPLSAEFSFDWQGKMARWKAAFALFKEYKNYEREARSIAPFTSFFLYLGVYLPSWCLKNPDSKVKFPEKITDFKGGIFVYRPRAIDLPDVSKPPLTFRQFNDKFNEGSKPETLAKCMRCLRDFFNEIISHGEYIDVPTTLVNPVTDSAVPACGGRPMGCVKADIPAPIMYLALLYSYRLLDYMQRVNDALLAGDDMILSRTLFKFVGSTDYDLDSTNLVRDINEIDGFSFDTSAKFDGVKLNFDVVPKVLFTPKIFPIKDRGEVYLLDTAPLEHIILMLETGLRAQSIQWLDTTFDHHIKAKKIDEQGIYPLHVNTDKTKNCAWVAYVAGRVINLLRSRRCFRDKLDGQVFKQDIYYEGNPESKWGRFKPLFSTNIDTGFPYCDATYSTLFKVLFHSLQRYVDILGLNYIMSTPDKTKTHGFNVEMTPHSCRKGVVMASITYLPPEYIGKYITGQTPRTVAYYAASNPDTFNRLDNHQAFQVIDGARRAVDTSRGPEVTEPHKPNSALARAFATNIKQAIHDFGAMTTAVCEQDIAGLDLLVHEEGTFKLLIEPTHICPYGGDCPPVRVKQKLARRCNFCDSAVRTIENLPAITAEQRNILDSLREVGMRLDTQREHMSVAQRSVLESRRRMFVEDLFALRIAEVVLDESLKKLKREYREHPELFCFAPEILVKGLEAAPFPCGDPMKELLYRLNETKTYFSLYDGPIRAKFSKFYRLFLSGSVNLDEFLQDDDFDAPLAMIYSQVHTLKSMHNLTLDQLIDLLRKDINEVRGRSLGHYLLPEMFGMIGGSSTMGISL